MTGVINRDDFTDATMKLHELAQASASGPWRTSQLITFAGDIGMRIRRVQTQDPPIDGSNDMLAISDLNDSDDEALTVACSASTSAPRHSIFDIIRSPTYQVPVLYIYSEASRPLSGISPISGQPAHIPPTTSLQSGHITLTDHPWLNTPVYFVHPCNTAEAMQAICGEKKISPLQYLVAWCGLIGGVVDLEIPMDIAVASATDPLSKCG
ncbi:hypothetical protein K461DRAFT_10705 [Myriangium duriaei CBS 260.36]|uniref:Ubiquitin-like-conjugating enzyme ATG10 n=1 Tax=Myriangium duriaei CBS 260.36 TaxID=1168546 RepID=A0A9P4J8P4_9PEZI|nr:hypothetical protein K461DRAFT_10705 [Myriangium duriaei CBS 260.36]